ncbi:MAG: hypothetical protein QNJ54_23850 [Prochloraceae cyanobacterium]|nr:hypothetical protein [Prochloraceae cyanobacterium]
MNQAASVAASLAPEHRKKLAIKVLAKNESITNLALKEQVSRKFLYQQKQKVTEALDYAFTPINKNEDVLFYLPITKTWLHQLILALILICHSSYRGVQELLRDLFDYQISLGSIHNLVYSNAEIAKNINEKQDLSSIKIGLHDEIFQGGQPVLTGIDNFSTYCYLLTIAEHRDEDNWGYCLLNLTEKQGLKPERTIADAAKGLRAGQSAVWPDIPCNGDIFHIKRQYQKMLLSVEKLGIKAIRFREKIEEKITKINRKHHDFKELCEKLISALKKEEVALQLYDELQILIDWLSNDVLALGGVDYNQRLELYDFIVEELKLREQLCAHRIRPVRTALENQREDLLAFAQILDQKLAEIARNFEVTLDVVREILSLKKISRSSLSYWELYNQFYQKLGSKFYFLVEAITQAMKDTPRASSMVENLNSRLRNYFFLRKELGQEYLDLLRFFLNHRTFMRSEHPERVSKSPTELLTGKKHPHWLELLGFERFKKSEIAA